MNCPYCDAELIWHDSYGSLEFIRGRENKTGDIYKCPNYEGFETSIEALKYVLENEITGHECLEEVVCYSNMFNGFFYIDSRDELHEGYPC